jgi:hypothetical protein
MTEKNFDRSDYKKLNGKDWLGKPLGWKSIGFQSIMLTGIASIFYFIVPAKNSSQTLYELYGLKYAVIVIPILLFTLIYLYKGLKDVNSDYEAGKKIVFKGTAVSFHKGNFGFETEVILKEDILGNRSLKLNTRNKHVTLNKNSNYEFEMAPKSRIILNMKEIK